MLNDVSQEWTTTYEPSDDADAAKYDALLDARIASAPVVMFSFSTCRYCKLAKEALDAKRVTFRLPDPPDGAKEALILDKAVVGYGTGLEPLITNAAIKVSRGTGVACLIRA